MLRFSCCTGLHFAQLSHCKWTLTLWDHNRGWNVLAVISGIVIFSWDETQLFANTHWCGNMPTVCVWWWNQLKARHKTRLFTKASKRPREGGRLNSGPRTAPVAFHSLVPNTDVSAHVQCISRKTCQGYVNIYRVSGINHSCLAGLNLQPSAASFNNEGSHTQDTSITSNWLSKHL